MKWIEYKDFESIDVTQITKIEKGKTMYVPTSTAGTDFAIKFVDYNKKFKAWEFETEHERDKVYDAIIKDLKEDGTISEIVP